MKSSLQRRLRKNGRYVKFHLPDQPVLLAPNPRSDPLMPALVPARLSDPGELDLMASRIHVSDDAMLVGIYQSEGRDPITGRAVPEQIVPLRAEPTAEGHQNLRWLHDNAAILLAFDPACLIDLQVAEIPEDVPAYRLATMDPDFLASFDE